MSAKPNSQPNVLYLLVDCLRSDKCLAPELESRLPNIHKLVRKGVAFTDMITVNSYTVPCTASAFTGLYPVSHGVRTMLGRRLPSSVSTLAELFAQSGYRTYGEVAGPLEASIGFDRGFGHFRMRREEQEHIHNEWGDRIVELIRQGAGTPWFIYLHFWEVHQPRRVLREFDQPRFGEGMYERAVASWDKGLGRILDALPPDTLVVLTGDHGEVLPQSKFEDRLDRCKAPVKSLLRRVGLTTRRLAPVTRMRARLIEALHRWNLIGSSTATMVGHGFHAYDALVRVPFVLAHPELIPQARRVSRQVSQVDIFPTLIDLLGLAPPRHQPEGRSLRPFISGSELEHLPAFIEAGSAGLANSNGKPRIGAVRFDGWKYVFGLEDPRFEPELYNLKADPAESRNLAAEEPGRCESLRKLSQKHFARGAIEESVLSEDERSGLQKRLRDLGYME